jgi:catechol 2,3-dioxygenase-like lactoylglutathione lyase family enzyme
MVKVLGLDHIVLRVADVERSLAWYRDDLGLEPERVAEWRRGEVLFPSVRIDKTTGIDGDGLGLYVRDPDGNVVELRHYGSE